MLEQQQLKGSGTTSSHLPDAPRRLKSLGEEPGEGLSAQTNLSLFAGPTSANFSLGLARLMLDQDNTPEAETTDLELELAGAISLGRDTDEDEDEDEDAGNTQSSELQRDLTTSNSLYGMPKAHALELIQLYHECVGVLHPIVNVSLLKTKVDLLWTNPNTPLLDRRDLRSSEGQFTHLKMVLAIGLMAEGGGSSAMGERIFNELQPVATSVVFAKSFSLQGQILLLLMVSSTDIDCEAFANSRKAFFHTFKDDCRLASRYVAIACRLMIEAGLHQKHVLMRRFPQSETRTEVIHILLTSVILDRQLNFNAGLPFTLKDSDIDITEMVGPDFLKCYERLPCSQPQDIVNPYAKAMISYIRIGPPALAAVTDERGKLKQRIKDEDFDYSDYQVQRWLDSLPAYLRFETNATDFRDTGVDTVSNDRGLQFLRYILYLRANQFRIVIMRPLLFSSQTYMANPKRVGIVAQIANDTVQTIMDMNEKDDLYKRQQPVLNLFLSSALSALFLVYIHSLREERMRTGDSPSNLPTCNQMVREGLNKGLGLVQSYSTYRSSQRLWQKFAGPQGLLPRLGLANQTVKSNVATSEALSSTGVSSQSSTRLDSSEEADFNRVPYEMTTTSGTENPTYAYPPAQGFELTGAINPFGAYDIPGEFSPLPFLNMNPLLVSNDIDVFYDDIWENNMF
jgi:hypothetical protein